MQQTENLKLNLIETGDPLSPAPINENAQKLEAALTSEVETRQAETAGLDSRVAVLEAKKMVMGTYHGIDISAINISLGFRPVAVFLFRIYDSSSWFISSTWPVMDYWHITDDGFSVDAYSSGNSMNNGDEDYLYIAVC